MSQAALAACISSASIVQEKKSKEVLGGVIALRGDDGKEVWRCPFYTDVLDVACHTDVNNDGIVDCAVLGSTGLLATVNASNGHTFWYLHDHDDRSAQISAISSPCFLTDMDFDRDGVDDFAITGVMTYDGFRNVAEATPIPSWKTYDEQVTHVGLLLVSGSNGQIIGQPLPLPDMLTPGSSIGYRKIPNLVVYSLGNSTKSLLLLLGSGDGSRINQQNNPETVLMISIDDLYAGATRDRKFDDPYNVEFRNVYSAKGNIHSITIMEYGDYKAGDVLLLTNNDEELICLDGANDLRMKWKYNKDKWKISKPVLGKFDTDAITDILIILTPLNCSSCDCKSEIMVLNGKDGQEMTHTFTKSIAYNPIVLYNKTVNATDKFLFKNAVPVNESKGQGNKQSEEKLTYSNEKRKLNQNHSAVLRSSYTNISEEEIWTDIHHYDASNKNNLDQLSKGNSSIADGAKTSTIVWNVVLMEFQAPKGIPMWEIDLPSISICLGISEDDNDIIIQDLQFGLAYLLAFGEINGTSKVDMINLTTRISSNSCNKAGAMLHPTSE